MEKETKVLCICLLFFFTTVLTEANATSRKANEHDDHVSVKLFVFGDSYADTGNSQKPGTISWKPPYGITYPGKPSGRFSDGRVLTDYIASYLGIESPIPYKSRNETRGSLVRYGMNFAHGGTGVFNTLVSEPNVTTQINIFQELVEQHAFTKEDLKSSIALVSLGGNDYAAQMIKNGSRLDLAAFTSSVITQLTSNIIKIHDLGVQKIAITAIEPMGCLPQLAAYSSYKNCTEAMNKIAVLHNQILQQNVQKLNNDFKKPVFLILDLHAAFLSAFKDTGKLFKNPLEPCCVGTTKDSTCGSVDESGAKKYVICKNPESSFFWDMIHPSQSGWNAVYSAIKPSLKLLYN